MVDKKSGLKKPKNRFFKTFILMDLRVVARFVSVLSLIHVRQPSLSFMMKYKKKTRCNFTKTRSRVAEFISSFHFLSPRFLFSFHLSHFFLADCIFSCYTYLMMSRRRMVAHKYIPLITQTGGTHDY